jgi:hypothetical protein
MAFQKPLRLAPDGALKRNARRLSPTAFGKELFLED